MSSDRGTVCNNLGGSIYILQGNNTSNVEDEEQNWNQAPLTEGGHDNVEEGEDKSSKAIQQLRQNMEIGVLIERIKKRRIILKIIQFVFAIVAFATTVDFSSKIAFLVICTAPQPNVTVSQIIEYPFQVDTIHQDIHFCDDNEKALRLIGDFWQARFFVAVGVLAFLYTIATFIFYFFFHTIYDKPKSIFQILDSVVHAVFAVMWLIASCLWAAGLTYLLRDTALAFIKKFNPDICYPAYDCSDLHELGYAQLVVSIIFGFLNVILWGGNLFFFYQFYKDCKAKNATES